MHEFPNLMPERFDLNRSLQIRCHCHRPQLTVTVNLQLKYAEDFLNYSLPTLIKYKLLSNFAFISIR